MAGQEDKTREKRDLAFLGAITASVSHDLSNIVCVLHQVGGLLGDMIGQSEKRSVPVDRERLVVIRDRLERQSERAKKLTEQLNRFAHGIDCRWMEFDLNPVIENLMAVTRRFADLKRVQVTVHYEAHPVTFVGDPFFLQQVIFQGLRRAFDLSQSKETVLVSVCRSPSGPEVVISRPSLPSEIGLESLRQLAEEIPARIAVRREEGQELLRICLTAQKSAEAETPSSRPLLPDSEAIVR